MSKTGSETALVKAMNVFRRKHEEAKLRQRLELAAELAPFKADIGDEINTLRSQGYTVAEIADIIGKQNRTFIYDTLTESKLRSLGKPEPTKPESDDVVETYYINGDDLDNQATVTIGSDVYTVNIYDGVPEPPAEWLEDTPVNRKRKKLYAKIIAKLSY